MNGFQAQQKSRQASLTGKQSTATALSCVAVCLSLCLTSGCAMTRKAWSGLHNATCGEPASRCSCTCSDCIAGVQTEQEAGHHTGKHYLPQPDPRAYAATPSPLEGSLPVDHGAESRAATLNGQPGVWTPLSPPAHFKSQDPNSALTNTPAGDPGSHFVSPQAVWHSLPAEQPAQSAVAHGQPVSAPVSVPQNDDVKEYRTQVQILSEQISQMKNVQDSMKTNQETLQQTHARELLELRLQQTTADRDRLQREHDLEQELKQQQQQHELEMLDRMQQALQEADPASSPPNASLRRDPRSTAQFRQVSSVPARDVPAGNLPTVDESL